MRFVDTSYWCALADRGDRRHHQAHVLRTTGSPRLVTTNHVLGETWTLVRRRLGHAMAIRVLDAILAVGTLEFVAVDARLENDAWRWLRAHDEREYSFVDATSFAVMRSRRIREALAFDGDFNAAGVVEVRA